MNGKTVSQINKNMVKYVPELDSEYASYPLTRTRWYDPTELDERGEPCFLPVAEEKSTQPFLFKLDYVYCERGPLGRGFYSLLTKVAYVNLYTRINQEGPPQGAGGGLIGGCSWSKKVREAHDDWDDVKRIVFGRHVAPTPDEQVAAKAAVDNLTFSHEG